MQHRFPSRCRAANQERHMMARSLALSVSRWHRTSTSRFCLRGLFQMNSCSVRTIATCLCSDLGVDRDWGSWALLQSSKLQKNAMKGLKSVVYVFQDVFFRVGL